MEQQAHPLDHNPQHQQPNQAVRHLTVNGFTQLKANRPCQQLDQGHPNVVLLFLKFSSFGYDAKF